MLSLGTTLLARNVITELICFSILITATVYCRADMLEITPLSFGRFVIADNSSVSTLTVYYDGRNPRASNKIYPIERGTPGEYQLSNYPAFMPLNITIISTDDLSTSGPTEEMTLSNFTHANIRTDANGQAVLIVGATLSTSGNGNNYVSSNYSANYIINIDF